MKQGESFDSPCGVVVVELLVLGCCIAVTVNPMDL